MRPILSLMIRPLVFAMLALPMLGTAPALAGSNADPVAETRLADGYGGYRGYYGRPGYRYRDQRPRLAYCVAAAFRGNGRGPMIRGTRVSAEASHPARACDRAVRRCYRQLSHVPHGPRAQCLVMRSS